MPQPDQNWPKRPTHTQSIIRNLNAPCKLCWIVQWQNEQEKPGQIKWSKINLLGEGNFIFSYSFFEFGKRWITKRPFFCNLALLMNILSRINFISRFQIIENLLPMAQLSIGGANITIASFVTCYCSQTMFLGSFSLLSVKHSEFFRYLAWLSTVRSNSTKHTALNTFKGTLQRLLIPPLSKF